MRTRGARSEERGATRATVLQACRLPSRRHTGAVSQTKSCAYGLDDAGGRIMIGRPKFRPPITVGVDDRFG